MFTSAGSCTRPRLSPRTCCGRRSWARTGRSRSATGSNPGGCNNNRLDISMNVSDTWIHDHHPPPPEIDLPVWCLIYNLSALFWDVRGVNLWRFNSIIDQVKSCGAGEYVNWWVKLSLRTKWMIEILNEFELHQDEARRCASRLRNKS